MTRWTAEGITQTPRFSGDVVAMLYLVTPLALVTRTASLIRPARRPAERTVRERPVCVTHSTECS